MQLTIPTPSAKSAGLFLAGVLLALGVVFGPGPAGRLKPKPYPPAPAPAPAPKPDWFGWRGHDTPEARTVAASMPKLFQAAPGLATARDASDGRPILLYRAWTDLFAGFPPYPAQQIGDCVSFGHGHANDLLQCIEWCIAHPGRPPTAADIQETDTEALYGMAREAGGMLGWQDGCYGGAAVKAMTTMGVVSRRQLGDNGAYSGRRAKAWGRSGAPDSVKQIAKGQLLGSAAQVTTWDELVAALHNGNPVTICSNQGFTLQRDSDGFCRAEGRWPHCMLIAGVRFDRPGACIVQSWGMKTPSGPLALGQPPYSFWADRQVTEHILSQGDSWALSKAPHFGQAAAAKGRRRLPAHWRKASYLAPPAPLRRAA